MSLGLNSARLFPSLQFHGKIHIVDVVDVYAFLSLSFSLSYVFVCRDGGRITDRQRRAGKQAVGKFRIGLGILVKAWF